VSVIPFQLVQRLQAQDEPGVAPGAAIRNNVLVAGDVGWRVAPGTRVYGEALIDDFHLIRRVTNPNKYAYQLGWEGVGPMFGTRVTWGGEFTRITQFVYTSYFGRDFVAQGRPLGFPVAPDARRVRLRVGWDPSVAWQLNAVAAETWKGENSLADPFVPGPGASADAAKFLGVVEVTREIEAGIRWWPAGGADFEIHAGYRRVEDAGHVAGVNSNGAYGRFALRLVR
jgi:hypothetical protein